jgi:hypothetical protein
MLALAGAAYTLANVSLERMRAEESISTQAALMQAKRALLDFAATYEDRKYTATSAVERKKYAGQYGFLPCPDYLDAGEEGGADGNCLARGVNAIGTFPWATLETGVLKSGSGQCLWYAVSGEYKSSPKTRMLNEDTNGGFRLYNPDGTVRQGALAQDRVVAVIIDPSIALAGQSRNYDDSSLCGKDYNPAAYLEGNGAINNALLSGTPLAVDDFITRGIGTDGEASPFNDALVTITRDELWDAIHSREDFVTNSNSTMKRLTEALALCIAAYGNASGNRKLPRPAPVDFSGADYRLDANYSDTPGASYVGRFPYVVNDSDTALGSSYAPNDAEPILFEKGYCNELPLTVEPKIDLRKVPDEGSQSEPAYPTWKNWKDHFFYAVSSRYAPASTAGAAACDGASCIAVDGTEYAAVVIYAGSRMAGQVRNEPVAGDADTKKLLANYLEVVDPIGDGTGDYTPTGDEDGKDIAFCITDENPFDVVGCP